MRIHFIAGFAPIVRDLGASRKLFADTLGIAFESVGDDYVHTENLRGAKHFGLWPLAEAAQACFGTRQWPSDVPVPQASIEFEVDDVAEAAAELDRAGYRLLHTARTEPWQQTVARLLSPDGLIVGICFTPSLRAREREDAAIAP